jgi:hypothetical protein
MICKFLTLFEQKVRVKLRQLLYSSIDTPFELLKQDINNTFANLTFDSTLLPVPDQNRLSFSSPVVAALATARVIARYFHSIIP